MKDIIITSKKLKQERNIFLLSFLLAFIINVIAIIIYSRPWIEICLLYTSDAADEL